MTFNADGTPTLERELKGAAHSTAARERCAVETTPEWRAMEHIDRLEIALHTILGHGNITVDRAKKLAAEALGLMKESDPSKTWRDADHPSYAGIKDHICYGCGRPAAKSAWGPWCYSCNFDRMTRINEAMARAADNVGMPDTARALRKT